ncbi:SpoIIE family protein phosphatase [Dactylosporangium sp. CS-033363]|uniref:SpoIIE family protein phosphatase n=1 Tax=Dactylosporangium sp. CS-033363 TaxID=3239935 RepID=UPI003D8D784C
MSDGPRDDRGRSGVTGDLDVVRSVFEELPLVSYATDGPEHRIVATNAMFRQYVGRTHMIGMPLADAFPESMGQQIVPIFDQVLATGEQVYLRSFRAQLTRQDTGEQIEVYTDLRWHPRHGPDGKVVGVIVDLVDVTEQVRQHQAEQRRTAEAERRLEQARGVITTLQRELLPAGVPVLPRVQVSASYLLADADTAAGGDWFDALTLADGRFALIVGDVVGHGVAASATMGQLRLLLHERLAATSDIAAAMAALDAAATEVPAARATTVCVVALDPATGALQYCTAGHPPPLVVSREGATRYLPATGAGPIGVGGAFTGASIGKDRLADGELILLYSDGILERPGRDLAGSTVELATAVADIVTDRALQGDSDLPAERVCVQTLELLTRASGHTDDITLLAAQRVDPPPPLRLPVTAELGSLQPLRDQVKAWLTEARIDGFDAGAVLHAVVELATNVIDHAWIDSADRHAFTVTAALTGTGRVELSVADRGRWREPSPSPDRGLGLVMTTGLVDRLRIEHDANGTSATVTHRVRRPARLLTANDLTWTAAPRNPAPPLLLMLDQPSAPGPRIRADGPVDAATVAEFDRTIRAAGSSGTRPLTVDLTGVSHLASAGVSALHRLAALHRDNGTHLRLYAPAGTPADAIMSLVALDHETRDPDYPDVLST